MKVGVVFGCYCPLHQGHLDTIMKAENGHIGGNMSSVELLTTLYFGGQFNFGSCTKYVIFN